jgi:hypothetical protein
MAPTGVLVSLIGSSSDSGSGSGSIDASHLRSRARARPAGPDLRTRHRIILVSIVDTKVEWRVILLVSTGEFDGRPGRSISTTDNLDLSAPENFISIHSKIMRGIRKLHLRVVELGLPNVGTVHTCSGN